VKILITGVNGFVGKYLSTELRNAGHLVFGIDTTASNTNIYAIDICDEIETRKILNNIRPDFVFHLAAIANVDHKNPSKVYDINIGGTKSVLSSIISLDYLPKLVFISSSQVYGKVSSDKLPITEEHPVMPVNHYGASKAAGEILVQTYGYEYNLQYMIFRPFNHTGLGQSDKFVIPKIVNAFREKNHMIDLGNIDVIRDFTDVRDVVRGYAAAIERFSNKAIYNISSGSGITIRRTVDLLSEISGQSMIINEKSFLKRTNEIESVIGDNRKIKTDLDWSLNHSFKDTLTTMLHF
jgi:GDP-6-deoxy-D-talose 4-dehydrogenase